MLVCLYVAHQVALVPLFIIIISLVSCPNIKGLQCLREVELCLSFLYSSYSGNSREPCPWEECMEISDFQIPGFLGLKVAGDFWLTSLWKSCNFGALKSLIHYDRYPIFFKFVTERNLEYFHFQTISYLFVCLRGWWLKPWRRQQLIDPRSISEFEILHKISSLSQLIARCYIIC